MTDKRAFLNLTSIVVLLIVLSVALTSSAGAAEGKPNPGVLPPNSNSFGKSYAAWGGEWWEWQLSLPATNHPAFDDEGTYCDAGQSGKVWFLTGTFTSEVPPYENPEYPGFSTVVREACHVPTGKAIFFPILNAECSTGDPQDYLWDATPEVLEQCVTDYFNGNVAVVADLSATVDGRAVQNLEAYRAETPVFSYSFEDPNDNINGVDCSAVRPDGVGPACENAIGVGDGYWIMLAPLSKGEHTIRFTGSFVDPADPSVLYFGLDVTYLLTVD